MPVFPGGMAGLTGYIQKNFVVPGEVRESGTPQEKAFVEFVVDTNGKILRPAIVRHSASADFDKEAIRLVSAMPDWKPGINKGKKEKVLMTIPVTYKRSDLSNSVAPPKEKPATPEHERAMELYYAGHKLHQKEQYAKALEKFDNALKVEPDNKFALYDKAQMHLLLGDKLKACDSWSKMVSSNIRKTEAEEAIKKNCN